MSINDGLMEVAELRIVTLNGTAGIGFHRLQFSLEIQLRATRGRIVQLGDLSAQVYAGTSASALKPLAIASPETSWWTHTTDDPRREFLSLYVDLASEQLEALERLRRGGPLSFQFDLRMLVRSEARGTQPGFDKLGFEANVSEWSRVLQQLGYLECLLVSLELPIAVPEELRNALAQLRAAHQDLIAGRYDSCIGRCRIAMDALEAVVGYGSAVADVRQAFASKNEREAMAKRARADLVRLAVRHYTHLAHHVDDNGAPESFSRQDALFILSATAGAVWDATAELRKRD
jgi:hypothetical protein